MVVYVCMPFFSPVQNYPFAGLFRVLGADLAELPLVACRPDLQGQGLARLLLKHIEAMLLR